MFELFFDQLSNSFPDSYQLLSSHKESQTMCAKFWQLKIAKDNRELQYRDDQKMDAAA